MAAVLVSGAERQLESAIFIAGMQAVVRFVAHQADRDHQAVAADFGNHLQRGVERQAQQLEGTALWQVLLELATHGNYLLGGARVTQHFQQKMDRFGQRCERGRPALQVLLAHVGAAVLPGKIGWQVELARSAWNPHPAADAHEPVVFRERLSRLAGQAIECTEVAFELVNHFVQNTFGNGRVAAVAVEDLLLFVQIPKYIGLEIGPGTDVHDFKNGGQCEVVIQRIGARHQLGQAQEKVLQPQIGANALVEGVFVKDHADFSGARIIARTGVQFAPPASPIAPG